jgi:glutamate synthase domain-containing protein 2
MADHVGIPLVEALSFVHNALVGANLRERIKLGASGKVITAYDICRALALGADYVLSARGFMFSVGCIQARSCHSNACPTGVATQDPARQRALVVSDKAPRVANFQRNTLKALAELLGSAGLNHPSELRPWHLHIRHASGAVVRGDEAYRHIAAGTLLSRRVNPDLALEWDRAQPTSFQPQETVVWRAESLFVAETA